MGRGELLAVREVDQVGGSAAVHGREQGQQVWSGPPAGRLSAVARPVLVLAQMGGGHPGEPARVEADVPAELVDPVRGLLQAPAEGFPPGGAGP